MYDPPSAPLKSLPPLVTVASAPKSPLSPRTAVSSRSSPSYLSPISPSSTSSPRSPMSSLFGVAKKVSSARTMRSNLKKTICQRFLMDAIMAVTDAIAHPGAMDDRKMLLEDVITLLSSLPPDSDVGASLERTLIRLLWNDFAPDKLSNMSSLPNERRPNAFFLPTSRPQPTLYPSAALHSTPQSDSNLLSSRGFRHSNSTSTRERPFANLIVAAIAPMAKDLIDKSSWPCRSDEMRLDIVREVVIPVCMAWISDQLGFPLKTKANPRGVLTSAELYRTLSDAYTYLHLNHDASQGFKLRDSVTKHTAVIKDVIDFRLAEAHGTSTKLHNLAADIKSMLLGDESGQGIVMSNNARKLYDRVLTNTSRPLDEIADALQLSMINFVSAVTACAKSLDFFLRPENANAIHDLHSLTNVDLGLAHDSTIQNFIHEALRLEPAVGGVVRQARSAIHLGNSVTVAAGALFYVDWTQVNRDGAVFARPDEFKPDRNPALYRLAEPGIRSSRDESINSIVATAICREVFRLVDLRRAGGPAGRLGAVARSLAGPFETATRYVVPGDHSLSFFPHSMVVLHRGRADPQLARDEHVWDLLD
ncbi:hypothetical protein JCM11491_004067 [Sporobolomyces phaffii]